MKSICKRKRFIKVYNFQKFDELFKNRGYFELQKFVCTKAPSLQKFFRENVDNSISIFIIYDTNARIIVGYFTFVATCMLREYEENGKTKKVNREIEVQKNISCLEIEKFAINEKYLDWLGKKGYNNRKIGQYVFEEYISKAILLLSEYIGFSYIVLHSINSPKVINAYKNMDFETFEDDEMKIVSLLEGVTSIKESYVNDCKFMYQPLELIVNKVLEGGM